MASSREEHEGICGVIICSICLWLCNILHKYGNISWYMQLRSVYVMTSKLFVHKAFWKKCKREIFKWLLHQRRIWCWIKYNRRRGNWRIKRNLKQLLQEFSFIWMNMKGNAEFCFQTIIKHYQVSFIASEDAIRDYVQKFMVLQL